jgi:predicted acylesterase/phospholipase RssA
MNSNLIIQGGSYKAFASIGAIRYLHEQGKLDEIVNYAGSSSGAILCLLLVIGYLPIELHDIIYVQDFNKIMYDNLPSQIWNTLTNNGLNSGKKLLAFISNLMVKKNVDPDITFKDLYNKTNKVLVVTGTNVTNGTIVYFHHTSYPNLKVLEALKASFSIPYFFTPHKIENEYYVDGGVLMNFPLYFFDHESLPITTLDLKKNKSSKNTIGIMLVESNNRSSQFHGNSLTNINLFNFTYNLVNTCLNNISENNIKNQFWNRVIPINLDFYDVSLVKFNPPDQLKKRMFQAGYDAAVQFTKQQQQPIIIPQSSNDHIGSTLESDMNSPSDRI